MDQPDLEAEVAEPPAPVVGAAAGLHRHHPGRQLDHGVHQLGPAHPARDDGAAVRVDAMELEDVLGQIDAEDRDAHDRLSLS